MDIQKKVIEHFSQMNLPSLSSQKELLSYDYIKSGLLDSVQVIDLIGFLEDTFTIRLTDDDLQSERFRTIGGLIEIVEKRKNK
jgi:acyl carrier protein